MNRRVARFLAVPAVLLTLVAIAAAASPPARKPPFAMGGGGGIGTAGDPGNKQTLPSPPSGRG